MRYSILLPYHDPNYQKTEKFSKLIRSVVRYATTDDYEFVIVKDGPSYVESHNRALSNAKGDYFLIFNDDMLSPNFLEETERALDRGADIATTFLYLFGNERGRHGPEKYPFFTSLFKKSLWETLGGFDPEMLSIGDRDFWYRCLESGAKMTIVDSTVYFYRKHPDQDSNSVDWEEVNKRFKAKHNL